MTGEGKPAEIDSRYIAPIAYEDLYPAVPSVEAHTIFQDDSLVPSPNARRIFGQPELPGCHYVSSDMIKVDFTRQHGLEVASATAEKAVGNANTAEYFQTVLRVAYGNDDIVLRHLMTRKSVGNGHHHFVFGFTTANQLMNEEVSNVEASQQTDPSEQQRAAVAEQPAVKRLVGKLFGSREA